MAFQTADKCAEVVIDYTLSGEPAANVLHFHDNAGFDQGALDAVANIVDGIIGTQMLPILTSTIAYVGTRVRGLTLENDFSSSNSDSAGVGALTGNAMPNNVSLCLTLRTNNTGRSARGRYYQMPPNEADMALANTVLNAYRDDVVDVLTNIRAALLAASVEMVVLSRIHNKALRAEAIFFPVTSIVARNNRVDSQRGRLPAPE